MPVVKKGLFKKKNENKQGKIEDRSALRARKKKIVTPHFLAIGSKVLAMSSNCVTFFPP